MEKKEVGAMSVIPIVDVFAGPGGLNEGFSSLRDEAGRRIFESVASFEMDPRACQTLRLRAALRQAERELGSYPKAYYSFLRGELTYAAFAEHETVKPLMKTAVEEVHQIRLGEDTRSESDEIIGQRLASTIARDEPWALVGGPPCQAYSLAGRSRRTNDATLKDDHKHVLYREYLHIIQKFRPTIFVMENVKGMLSSQHEGSGIFEQIKRDLEEPAPGLSYSIKSFKVADNGHIAPTDYILKAEDYGIPQRRHRVILLGVKSDAGLPEPDVLQRRERVTVREAIGALPAIRSMVSPKSQDSERAWLLAQNYVEELVLERFSGAGPWRLGARFVPALIDTPGPLGAWLSDRRVGGATLHESRAHMPADLRRYGYLAHASAHGRAPKLKDLPTELLPNHRNATKEDAPFSDRFRVQHWDEPSTTVVSHISKDGHYYIHPDPTQMRSLTVREAARLQTFPDNYFFMGNRTQQYHQVGNAVPPLLARQMGAVVAGMLGRGAASLGI